NANGLNVQNVAVSPNPIELPGDLHLTIDANFTRALSSSKMEISLKRESLFGIEIPIPCILHVGSCTYSDLCTMVNDMITQDWAGVMGGIGKQVKAMLSEQGVDAAACPQPEKELHIHDYVLHLPQVPSVLSWFAAGDYHANVKVTENLSGVEILCLDLHMSLKQHTEPSSGGFLFG
ncbi:hypothetical protein FSP39_022918, partial [Pinctada imbricata]